MLKKITSIKNIGKFKRYESSELSLKNFVGVYSENGRGKTTLTSILRSLARNNPKIILGRRRLNEVGRPHFQIETSDGFISFDNGTWTSSYANFEIFDSHFINENLYSGTQVDINQKRNLYKFIIGDEAIKLNESVVSLNQKISELTSSIREKRAEITKLAGSQPDTAFLNLERVEDLELKIAAKEREVAAIAKKDAFSKKPSLQELKLANFNFESLETVLKRTVDGMSESAVERTKTHIRSALHGSGEDWLKSGVGYLGDAESCPFCEADVSKNSLIADFKAYFSREYKALKDELGRVEAEIVKSFSDSYFMQLSNSLGNNAIHYESWIEFVQMPAISYLDQKAASELVKRYATAFHEILRVVQRKRGNPLDANQADLDEFGRLRGDVGDVLQSVEQYNRDVIAVNAVIDRFRGELASSDLEVEKRGLAALNLAKVRFLPDVDKACSELRDLEVQKVALEQEKDTAKKQLDEATNKIPAAYQDRINAFLEKFAADFRIYDHKKINPRGEPATEYKILINGAEVPIGDSDSPEDVASFKNTLSEGDKNTLAFAYFLAKLDVDAKLNEKVIVFDDPISSLDSSRREWTKAYLRYFGGKARQLIVLSHDSKFLEELCIEIKKAKKEMTCLKIVIDNDGSVIEKSDFSELNKTSRARNIEKLAKYAEKNAGDPAEVIKSIRPVCESYIRDLFPNAFSSSDNLGSMIKKIREAPAEAELARLQPLLLDFETLNAYTTGEHHGNEGTTKANDEAQLRAQCALTLKLTGELAI